MKSLILLLDNTVNWDRVDKGYFSVINELFVRLYGRFHHVGYEIPNKAFDGREIRPDVSVGKCFSCLFKALPSRIDRKAQTL